MTLHTDWHQQFQVTGSVRIPITIGSVLVVGLASVVVISAAFTVFAFMSSSGDPGIYGWGSLVLTAVLGALAFLPLRYRGKALVVERCGVTMPDGARLDWSEIERVSWFPHPTGPKSLEIVLTPPAWQRYQQQQSPIARRYNGATRALTGRRSVYLTRLLAANTRVLAAWMDRYAMGDTSERNAVNPER